MTAKKPPTNTKKQYVLIARSQQQGQNLYRKVKQAGFEAIHIPLIDTLRTPQLSASDKAAINNIGNFDYLVFVSANAVRHAHYFLKQHLDLIKPSCVYLAVGKASAKAIFKYFNSSAVVPKSGFNSEALLKLPALANVKQRQILIIRGNGGREFLSTALQQKGAIVSFLECYTRIIPSHDNQLLNNLLDTGQISTICCSSLHTLQNLIKSAQSRSLFDCNLLSISPAMTEYAQKIGFKKRIIEAQNATDRAILKALAKLYEDLS